MSTPFQIIPHIFNNHEITKLVKDVNKFRHEAVTIHGSGRTMLQLEKTFSPDYIFHICDRIISKLPFSVLGCHDCAIIWTNPGSKAQDFHMDCLDSFPVMTILLNDKTPTEFLDITYNPTFVPQKFEYPFCWSDANSNVLTPQVQCGDGILFHSNMIHRGPKV